MARVTLQEYCDEARERISSGAYEEAIAICRHILKRYPQHIRTYQILGEACLEKGDLEEATDIFKRILEQADPENFVAHAGLGILCEEKGQIAEAIWYMERAFETAPNSEETRKALRRLYGKRDGTEPTRIKMNKAALARLYARGGQFRQAIDGFRALLELEANRDRMDLKVALAETLWRDGRREQAAEIAREILQTSPNCLKAILLLGMIQIEKGQDNQGWEILAKARRLDPENRVAQALFGERSPLPLKIVKIPRIAKEAEPEAAPTEVAEPAISTTEEEAELPTALEEEAFPEKELEAEPAPTEAAEPAIPTAEEETELMAAPEEAEEEAELPTALEEEAFPEKELEAEPAPTEAAEPAIPTAEEEAELMAAPEEEELEAEPAPTEAAEPAIPTAEEEAELMAAPEKEELEAEPAPTEAAEPAIPTAEEETELMAAPEEETFPEGELEAEAAPTEVAEPAIPTAEEEAKLIAAPEKEAIGPEEAPLAAAAAIPSTPLSDVERYKLHLEQKPKDSETRLALARAYRDQEQIKLALEQYGMLKRTKAKLLSEVISDIETVVASRPDNLEAHELLADLYVKDGQLQKAVDRYRWILRRLDERPA